MVDLLFQSLGNANANVVAFQFFQIRIERDARFERLRAGGDQTASLHVGDERGRKRRRALHRGEAGCVIVAIDQFVDDCFGATVVHARYG